MPWTKQRIKMSLKDKIQDAMKTAMKAKDQGALRALRAIKSAILLAETEVGGKEGLTEEEELKLLSKAVKQRKDSAAIYKEQNRDDLYATEVAEIAVIEQFLPEQLSEEEIKAKVEAIIEATGASSMRDMGKVMGQANKQMAGVADPKVVASLVKQALS